MRARRVLVPNPFIAAWNLGGIHPPGVVIPRSTQSINRDTDGLWDIRQVEDVLVVHQAWYSVPREMLEHRTIDDNENDDGDLFLRAE